MVRKPRALCFALSIIAAACSDVGHRVGFEPSVPQTGDWIVARYEAEPDTLNPLLFRSAVAGYTMFGGNGSQIYEFLLRHDTENWTLTAPLLAVGYPEISESHLSYTYTLRDGIEWHDGQPLTPEDVLFTFKAVMCRQVDSADKRSRLKDLINVDVLQGRRIRFSFSKPYVLNDYATGHTVPIIPKHIFDPDSLLDSFTFAEIISPKSDTDARIKRFSESFNKHPNSRMPVGTGPYKFVSWDAGNEIVLVRNDTYWGTKAYLDKLVFRVIPDPVTALASLKAGAVDLNYRLQPIQYGTQTSGEEFEKKFTKIKYTVPQFLYIAWNAERPFFKDKRVRQALTMLVNRQQIVDALRYGLGKVAASPFHPSSPDHNPNIMPLPYDVERAAALLDEAGWKDHDGDGVRDKDGISFRFEVLSTAGSTFSTQLSAVLKEEFRKAGLVVSDRTLDFPLFVEATTDHNYDAALNAWSLPLRADLYQIFHSSMIPGRGANWVGFRNLESDRLLEQAQVEFDPERRKQILWKWQELIHDEQPYTLLFYPEEAAAYDRRFQNVTWIPNRPGYDLNQWFVPRTMQRYGSKPSY
jgi:peptide/nickel transport system substrate-binding protein